MKQAGRALAALASLGLSAAFFVIILPKISGVGWDDVSDQLGGIPIGRLLELAAVWIGGLYLHTFVLTSALPGLRRRQAFALNLGGSGVSNVVPFGGAAGIGLNYAMLASWGYDRMRSSTYTLLANATTFVTRLLIAAAGILLVLTMPQLHSVVPFFGPRWLAAALIVLVGLASVLAHARAGWRFGRQRLAGGVVRRVESAMSQWRQHTTEVLRSRWQTMLWGGFGYAALQLLLLWLCLDTTNAHTTIAVTAVGFSIDRLLTMVPITPGGVGVVETAMVGAFVGFGGDPTAVVAGVILYRAFSFFLEIPVGGAVTLGWLAHRTFRTS